MHNPLALVFCLFLTTQLCVAQPASESVSIQVHVDQSEGSSHSGVELFRLRRAQLYLRSERQETPRRIGRRECRAGVYPGSESADLGRRVSVAEVGIHQRLLGGRLRRSDLQLDHSGSDFRHIRAARVKPLVEIGFMPEALSPHPQPYRHELSSDSCQRHLHRVAYPPKDYQKWSDWFFNSFTTSAGATAMPR